MKKLVLTLLLGVTTLTAFSQVPSYVPTSGLVGYWPFNGNANDESGNLNHGAVNGATLTTDRNGVANKAYSFDGVNDYIQCIKSGSVGNPNTSVSFWLKTNTLSSGHIFSYGGNGSSGADNRILINSYGSCVSSVAFDTYNSGIAFSNTFGNTWDFYVITYNGSISNSVMNANIYKNGILLSNSCFSSNSISTNFQDLYPITFGRYHGVISSDFLNANLDEIGFWNRVLTQQEITALYTGCSTPTATITPQSSTTFCQGGSVVLNASTGTGYTYEWYKDGNIINGSITSSYTANQSGSYTVKVINGSCNATSVATTVIVNPNPTATITPQGNTTFCQGGSVILNASIGTGYTYEWYKNGTIINGSITSSYTANQTGSYTVKVINGTCNATSIGTAVTANPNPTVSLANLIHIKSAPITLSGSPSGGTYSGPGVVGSTFSSTNAGLGKKTITYNYKYTNPDCICSATAITTVYDTTACSTFDTLFINIAVAGLTAPNNLGTLKIWPNPANDHITIDNGNFSILNGYSVKIETVLGQEVFKSVINQQQFSVDLSTWKGKGIYLVHVLDGQNNIIETKKIILQ